MTRTVEPVPFVVKSGVRIVECERTYKDDEQIYREAIFGLERARLIDRRQVLA